MSLTARCLRNLLRNTHIIQVSNNTKAYNFRLLTQQQPTIRTIHTELAKFSASNSNRSLKDSFNAKKAEKPVVEEDDEDDFDFKNVKNMEQLKEKVLRNYLKEESKHNAKLMYVGGLTNQLKMAKILSLSSSVMGIGLLPFLSNTLSASTFFAQAFVYGTTGFFIFATPLLSQYLTRRYVSRMYYNEEEQKFKAVLFNFFLREYVLEFELKDVYVPDIPGAFSTLKLRTNNRSLFVDLNQIDDTRLVEKIMGYDKPFDIRKYTEGADKEKEN